MSVITLTDLTWHLNAQADSQICAGSGRDLILYYSWRCHLLESLRFRWKWMDEYCVLQAVKRKKNWFRKYNIVEEPNFSSSQQTKISTFFTFLKISSLETCIPKKKLTSFTLYFHKDIFFSITFYKTQGQ